MPYDIKTNYRDCSGFAVVGPDGSIRGCHTTREEAQGQQAALYSVEEKVVKAYTMLDDSEKEFHDALVAIANKYGKFNNETSIYAGYEPAVENENILKGIICGNCSFWQGNGMCQIVEGQIEYNGYCRLAAIPSQLVNPDAPEIEVEEEEEMESSIDKQYTGCGCPTCKAMNIACKDCPVCKSEMDKAAGARVGQMVSWNSSGGRAEGKIKRIIRDGSYKVPDSDFTITGTADSPAAVIELYRDGKPTGRMVGHKLDTLTAKKSLWSGMFDPRSGMMKNG